MQSRPELGGHLRLMAAAPYDRQYFRHLGRPQLNHLGNRLIHLNRLCCGSHAWNGWDFHFQRITQGVQKCHQVPFFAGR